MNNKTLVWLGLIIIIVGGIWYFGSQKTAPAPAVKTETPVATTTMATSSQTFTVTGSNFSFDPKNITVHQGDTVTINFISSGGMHDFKIDEYNVATPKLSSGQTASVTFVADKTGSFQYYCSVGTHRAMGMWGTLIVE